VADPKYTIVCERLGLIKQRSASAPKTQAAQTPAVQQNSRFVRGYYARRFR